MPSATPPATSPTLPAAVRRGYGLGSVATGSFGTLPGLLLLPYLTDRLGAPAPLARASGRDGRSHRLRAQGMGCRPQPGRGAHQRPVDASRRPPAALPHP